MVLIDLQKYRIMEIVAVLKTLLAKAMRGELAGLAVVAKDQNREESIIFAGVYRANPSKAALAAVKMTQHATQMQDEQHTPRKRG